MEINQPVPLGRHILIQAIGNPSRGDDALGPLLLDSLLPLLPSRQGSVIMGSADLEAEWVYQLQVEQAEQWSHFDIVIVVDAHLSLTAPFQWSELSWAPEAAHELGISSHQVSPLTVLGLNHLYFQQHPQVFQLALRAESFELGSDLSSVARGALAAGLRHLTVRLACNESQSSKIGQL